jgi:RND family efflux transporter MFP subunit
MFIRRSILSIAMLTLLLAGCGKHKEASPASSLPVAKVRVQAVEAKKSLATEEVVGTVRPKLRATLEAKVSGRIDKMLVSAGQTVKAGELLAQLDAQEIQAKLDQAKAVREQAANDRVRYDSLLQQNAVTRQEYDAVQSRFRVADAGLVEAQTMFNYATITAPFNGVVTRKLADVGDLASPGKPLLELEAQDKLRLEADVPEALIARIKLGEQLPVRVSDMAGALDGTVAEISPTADANSRTFRVKLDLPASPELRAGQFGRVAVPVSESSALRVPESAVVQRGQMEIVFVAANNHAQLRLVKTGKRLGNEIEIVSGLNAGENVVTDGAAALVDGQPLEVVQ